MININMIKKIEDSKRKVKKDIYIKIFEQFCRKIQIAVDGNQKEVFLEVPIFLLGYPSYDIETAAVYLKRQLELSGFKVLPLSTISFNVSWYTEKEKKQRVTYNEPPPKYDPTPPTFTDEQFPSLINLKKAAKRYG